MDYITISIILIGFIGLAGLIFYLFKQNNQNKNAEEIERKLNEMFPNLLQNANAQLIAMANEKLGAEKRTIETDFSNKKESIEALIRKLEQEVQNHNQKLETAERDRIGSFNRLVEALTSQKSEIEKHIQTTEKLNKTAMDLKNVLSNNQARGIFGEQVADDLLQMNGFIANIDYTKQEERGESRPDFTIFLPDKTKINVDAKFPLTNLQRMIETEDPIIKEDFKKKFESDVKKKVMEVSTRNYINPEDNTVDFVILFIPNEMIFSYIYEHMNDVWTLSTQKKVIFAGPMNFTAIIRMIRQAYTNFRYQKDIIRIVNLIKEFEKQFSRYNEEFEDLGKKIDGLTRKYAEVNTTRTNTLLKTVDKIKISEQDQQPLIES